MQAFRRLPPLTSRRPCALTIGNFDGVHRGHQAILSRLVAEAATRGLPTCVLTFEPHPREYFASQGKGKAPARIQTLRDKLQALAGCGIDRVNIAHFNAGFAALSAEQFVDEVLIDGLQARYLLIGDDFRFGAGRRGDFMMLEQLAANRRFELQRMPTVTDGDTRISSSSVRQALADGDLQRAQQLLARPYTISGRVIHGRKLGRTFGYPTLNLRVPGDRPALSGVFAVKVHGLGGNPLPGVASLGTRPVVELHGRYLLEVHLFDFSESVYGRLISVEFVQKLRDEMNFPSLDALTEKIDDDARRARSILGLPGAGPGRITTAP